MLVRTSSGQLSCKEYNQTGKMSVQLTREKEVGYESPRRRKEDRNDQSALAPLKKRQLAGKSKAIQAGKRSGLLLLVVNVPLSRLESWGIVVSTSHKGKLSKSLNLEQGGQKGSWDLSVSLPSSLAFKAFAEIPQK